MKFISGLQLKRGLGILYKIMLQCIYQQPSPFERFVYDSLVRKKCCFKADFIVCHHTVMPKIWIVADLYSQLDPPLLSAHTLRKCASRRENFIADIMRQDDFNISYYNYSLQNCYIRRTSLPRQRNVIEAKLRELKQWQQLGHDLNSSAEDWIYNTIALDYCQAKYEKRVYLGFTTYVYNDATQRREKLGETIFSHAIYDSSEFLPLSSTLCSAAGGSVLLLKTNDCLKISPSARIHLLLIDSKEQSWQAEAVGESKNGGIYFVAPPYTGNWDSNDGNRLIDIQVLSPAEGWPTKSNFKFVYV